MYKRCGMLVMTAVLMFATPVLTSAKEIETYSAQIVTPMGEEAPVISPTQAPDDEDTEAEKEPVLDGVKLDAPVMLTYKSIKLTWNALADAKGYDIYRSTNKYLGYECIKTINSGTVTMATDKKSLKTGTKYYYKIQAFAYNKAGEKITGAFSKPVKIQCSLPPTKLSSAKVNGASLKLKWKKVTGADGYLIYKADEETGKFKQCMVIEGGKRTSCEVPASEANGSFTYMVKAYRLNGKKKVLAGGSNTKQATVRVFAYAGETYSQKCQRVFGQASYRTYPNALEASRNMQQITVKVWDVGPLGIKVSKTKTFSVNRNLAPTVEQIFKEIYEGKEKFPIKSVGGYSWRGNGSTSEHNQGTAIDINPNENYMIEGNGKISSGTLWAPGENAYSIPKDGEVVKIFAKYGFRWGGIGWSSGRKDYMHFSYFGG